MKIRIINLLKVAWIPVAVSWLGALLNTLVVKANDGMPTLNLEHAYGKWVPITWQTHYAFLGDVIPIFDFECSIGDVLMYIGTAIWLYFAVRYIFLAVQQTIERKLSWY